jgi:release factor glutamine methyltransferase
VSIQPGRTAAADSRQVKTEWTVKALLDWTEQFFRGKGIDSPRVEAQLLLAHVLDCKRIDLYTRTGDLPDESARTRFREIVKKRAEGCPVAYLIGRREFYLLDYETGPDVLIPRPETELLVMESLKRLKGTSHARILDLGTGSGCIAISLAKQIPTATVTATDISAGALATAARNAERHGVTVRVRFVLGDLFTPVSGEMFNMIVSNPPYVTTPDWEQLPKHIRDFEPRSALDAGPDGYAVYDRLLPGAARHLEPAGWLLLEIGAAQAEGIRERITAQPELEFVAIQPDAAKLPRLAIARRK